jgi:hypothetical protein
MGKDESDFWKAYRTDPEHLERKAQEKRNRQEQRDE